MRSWVSGREDIEEEVNKVGTEKEEEKEEEEDESKA